MSLIGRYLPGAGFLERAAQFIPSKETLTSLFEEIVVDPAGYTFFNNGDASRSFMSDLGGQLVGRFITQKKANYVLPYLHLINPNIIINGQPLIFLAVENDQPEAAEALLEAGADPNAKLEKPFSSKPYPSFMVRSVKNITPILYQARLRGRVELAKKLLEKGANPNEPYQKIRKLEVINTITGVRTAGITEKTNRFPLQIAAESNLLGIVRELLEYGALLEYGGLLDVKGGFFCYQAVKHNNLEMLRLFIDYGADPTLISCTDKSALAAAFRHLNQEMVDLLLEAGASLGKYSFGEAFFEVDANDSVRIVEMMLDSEKFTIPNFDLEDNLLVEVALSARDHERGRELAQRLRREGATIGGACELIARDRIMYLITEEESVRAREWLQGLVGGLTKSAIEG